MRCKTCHYSLQHLTEHRCPECGRAFDPNDPRTLYDQWELTPAIAFVLALMSGLTLLLPTQGPVVRTLVICGVVGLAIYGFRKVLTNRRLDRELSNKFRSDNANE